ncbi:DUF2442 domain-containing protein [Catalinimonas sp. 4WD22]|uniref:DUF2442 domain-containing protein n=1 Tax=Catalinimonas locisalis TaxID=3133978 RepID=UPI00310142B6
MIRITKLKVLDSKKIYFNFSDGSEKTIDFTPFIGQDNLSKPLSDPAYFKKVELYENGRGIYWPNDYDFCPDFLRQYQPEEKEELTEKS